MHTGNIRAVLLVFRYPFLFVWEKNLAAFSLDDLSVSGGVYVFSDGFEYQYAQKICKFLKLFTVSIYQNIFASRCEKGSDV